LREYELLGEYRVFLDHESPEAVVGRMHHFKRNESGGSLEVPVGHFAGCLVPGDDLMRCHWAVDLSLRSDVRYDPDAHQSMVVSHPERQAGANRAMLEHLIALRDSTLPYYHPSLPKQLGELLLRESVCRVPALVRVHHTTNDSFVQFGEVFHED
jgi:hypothetical protein